MSRCNSLCLLVRRTQRGIGLSDAGGDECAGRWHSFPTLCLLGLLPRLHSPQQHQVPEKEPGQGHRTPRRTAVPSWTHQAGTVLTRRLLKSAAEPAPSRAEHKHCSALRGENRKCVGLGFFWLLVLFVVCFFFRRQLLFLVSG